MQNINTIRLTECINHGRRTSRAPNDRTFQRGEIQTMGFHVAEQHLPYGGHTGCEGHLLSFDQFIDRFAIQSRARKYQFRTCHGCTVGNAPGVHMEHGHDRQNGITRRDAHHIWQSRGISMQQGGAVAVKRCFGIARGATGVTHAGSGIFIQLRPCVIC